MVKRLLLLVLTFALAAPLASAAPGVVVFGGAPAVAGLERRRPTAGALDRRCDAGRGRLGHGHRDLHGHALGAERPDSCGRLRDRRRHGVDTGRLSAGRRPTHLRAGGDDAAAERDGQRRHARRGERDLLRQPLGAAERDDRRRPGARHDHRRRRPVDLDRRRDRHRGRLGHGERELRRHPERAEPTGRERPLRNGKRDARRRRATTWRRAERSTSTRARRHSP